MFTRAARSVEGLSDTVGKIITLFKPQECADYSQQPHMTPIKMDAL
jgi:hypothetical protein